MNLRAKAFFGSDGYQKNVSLTKNIHGSQRCELLYTREYNVMA